MAQQANKVPQQKEKDFEDVEPREGFSDMEEEQKKEILTIARQACKKHNDGELKYYKTMAIYVKEELDKKLGSSWHVCIGKLHFAFPLRSKKALGQSQLSCKA